MSNKFVHLFPLSVYRDSLGTSATLRQQLADQILAMESTATTTEGHSKPDHAAWLGDEQGYEFLFQRDEFKPLFAQISSKVVSYARALGLDCNLIDFYFQRAWATVSRQGERISQHCHEQSHISFAYYLKKPAQGGGINFVTENHPNELSPGMFSPAKAELGLIGEPSALTWNTVTLNPAEDDIVIFPSKTLHSTVPNQDREPRISISADIVMMLKESRGHETMMPHFSQWRSLADFDNPKS